VRSSAIRVARSGELAAPTRVAQLGSSSSADLVLREQLQHLRVSDLVSLLSDTEGGKERYIDLKATDLYRPALRAIKDEKLKAFRIKGSRKLWVRADDFYAWVESPEHRVRRETDAADDDPMRDIDRLIDEHDRRRAG
jgi:hypothetical protein